VLLETIDLPIMLSHDIRLGLGLLIKLREEALVFKLTARQLIAQSTDLLFVEMLLILHVFGNRGQMLDQIPKMLFKLLQILGSPGDIIDQLEIKLQILHLAI